ncbi:MAG: DUF1992 domain-containing protein [Bacillota bacterium]|nr:DUF1992 domain-containing protein [Bacillota bacterium]
MSDKSLEEEIKIKARENRKIARYMSSTQDLVEEQIRKAQAKGAFNHLEGEGTPLDLEENPYVPAELRMAFKILKDNNFAPYWIELGKDIDSDWNRIADEVHKFKRYCHIFWIEKPGAIARRRFNKKKEMFYYEKRLELEKIEKKIIDYNLHCPTFRLGRPGISVEDEMQTLIAGVEKEIHEAINAGRICE